MCGLPMLVQHIVVQQRVDVVQTVALNFIHFHEERPFFHKGMMRVVAEGTKQEQCHGCLVFI